MRIPTLMHSGSIKIVCSALLVLLVSSAMALPRVHRGPTSPRSYKAHHSPHSSRKPAIAHAIESERATQIQTALIRSGYLSGAPSGLWNDDTQRAMQKYQADNGWQTKLIPDSRAIIKLGLGSSTAQPQSATSASVDQSSTSGSESRQSTESLQTTNQ